MHGFIYVLVYGTNNAYSEYACLCECLFIWRCTLYQSPAYLGHLSSNTPGTESPSLRVTFKLQFNTSLQRLFCRASDTQECPHGSTAQWLRAHTPKPDSGFNFCHGHLVIIQFGASHTSSLSLSFLICKMRVIIVSILSVLLQVNMYRSLA